MAYTTIDKPDDYFNTKLHTGDGGGSGSSTGIGFQPDMVWSKSRTEALNHTLFDSVRGAGSNKELTPNETSAEGGANSAGFGYISAFNSDGYSWTAGSTNTENFNKSSQTYANWCWLGANGTVANTDGSISSTVSANTTSGFSIVSYTGTGSVATVGHGLGVAPKIVLVKRRSQASNWCMYNENVGNTKALYLNNDTTGATSSTFWNNTTPTSSVFTVGSDAATNGSGDTQIAYCFAEKSGYSSMGKYTGNGNADGTFVYTGFKPAWIMIKQSDGANGWNIYDNKRNTFNVMDKYLLANTSGAEASYSVIDFLSNGIKLRNTASSFNTSGASYIYMAFAENPFVTSTGIPTTAR
jgi:hypothetical protein